jgi:hypothetical protein
VSAKVSTLLHVGGEPYRYAFVLVSWNDYADAVRDELNRQAAAFGADLGPGGLYVEAFPQRMYETAAEVLAKDWPEEIARRLADDQDPIILVIDQRFGTFDPRQHPYAVIWLSDLHADPNAVRPLLQTLAQKTRRDEDVVLYLRDVADRAQAAANLDKAGRGVRGIARLASYVELKPTLFGVSIDLKAILADIAAMR